MDPALRPRTVRCARCNRSIKVAKTGRLPIYCGNSCKQAVFNALNPKPPKPQQPKLSLEERVAMRVYQMLVDSNVVVPVNQPKPKPPSQQEQDT
jgi:hypothetical protein